MTRISGGVTRYTGPAISVRLALKDWLHRNGAAEAPRGPGEGKLSHGLSLD